MDREQCVPALNFALRCGDAHPRGRFRKAGYEAIDRVCDYMDTMAAGRGDVIAPAAPGYLAPLLAGEAGDSRDRKSVV